MKNFKSVTSFFILSFLLIFLSSCENIAKFTGVTTGEEANPRTEISFSGIDSIDNVTDTSAAINWCHVSGASSYQIFSVSGSTLTIIDTLMAPTSTYALTELTPSSTTTYVVRLIDSELKTDSNTNYVTITTKGAPDAPSALTLTSPNSSTNFDETPIITIVGVKSGDTIKLFTDSGCSTQTGNSTVATGTTVAITTSVLVEGTYDFYANSTGASGTSSCSGATVSYVKISCPTGYILVPANAIVGAPDNFCVMKYEAQNSDGTPVSETSGVPWTLIDQDTAKAACKGIDTNYDLISNPEWMAIARNVENVAENWTGNSVGIGCLKRGNVGSTDACDDGNLGTTDSSYTGANPDNVGSRTGYNDTAELVLDNGNSIFDLSGNVWEWVDWTIGGILEQITPANKAYDSGDNEPQSSYQEFKFLDTNIEASDEMPLISWQATNPDFLSTNGIGSYYAGDKTSGGATLRGGSWDYGSSVGVFALVLAASSVDSQPYIGFRCVFRVP